LVGRATTDTLTNKTLTGAAMNGTLGATTPSTVAATTLTTSSTVTLTGGTANGVAYLNGSKVLTTGSALSFDGSGLVGTGKFQSQLMRIKDSGYSELYFSTADAGGNGALSYEHSTNSLRTYVNGGIKTVIDSSGNLGIGTTSPSTYGKLAVNSTAIGGANVAITKEDSGSANQNGPILYMNNSGPAATGRNANVVAGQILWQFSQPSSGALQYAGEIAVLSDSQGGASTASSLNLYSSGGLGLTVNSSANTVIAGSLSKASGSFRIDHPLLELEETHQLVHSFIEGPQADLIYRGKVNLVNGTATVNIDTASTMTEGTFVALCRDVQCFTTNESDWTAVRGSVTGNILTIEAEDNTSTASISWMVIGERKDKHMMVTDWTDDNGKVIVEPLKEQPSTTALESA
jgi:hypothetical protein